MEKVSGALEGKGKGRTPIMEVETQVAAPGNVVDGNPTAEGGKENVCPASKGEVVGVPRRVSVCLQGSFATNDEVANVHKAVAKQVLSEPSSVDKPKQKRGEEQDDVGESARAKRVHKAESGDMSHDGCTPHCKEGCCRPHWDNGC